jgi:Tol biopolymer transport system component
MNRKILLTLVMSLLAPLSHGAVEERGNLVLDNIPSVDTPLTARLDDYMNSRGASFVDWLPDGGLLIATRFGDVDQLHRVAAPLGAREQLTFYREPVTVARSPQSAVAPGFVFLKDQGGNEYAQIYWYDTATRAVRMLTDGKGLHGGVVWSHDGRRLAFHGTGRDGVSYDLFLAEPANNQPPRLVYNGFQKNWSVQDFSPDDTKLLIRNFVSANESHLFVMDIATAALTPVSEGAGPASVAQAKFTAEGRGVYLITNRDSEFEQLRRVDLTTGAVETLTGHIPWDIESFARSDDGRYLAWVANVDGVSRLTLANVANQTESLPPLPDGQIGRIGFDRTGKKLALSLESAQAPRDVFVLELEGSRWPARHRPRERWRPRGTSWPPPAPPPPPPAASRGCRRRTAARATSRSWGCRRRGRAPCVPGPPPPPRRRSAAPGCRRGRPSRRRRPPRRAPRGRGRT